jgi:hypothetical protein
MVYNNKLHSHKYSAFMKDVMRIHVKQIYIYHMVRYIYKKEDFNVIII